MTRLVSRFHFVHYIMDVLLIIVSLRLSEFMRINAGIGLAGPDSAFQVPSYLYLISPLLWFLAFQYAAVYTERYDLHPRLKMRQVIAGNFIGAWLFFGMLYFIYRDFSRLQAFYIVLLVVISTMVYRQVWTFLYVLLQRWLPDVHHVLIVGDNSTGRTLQKRIAQHPHIRLKMIGFAVFDHEASDAPDIVGAATNLAQLVEQYMIHEVIIAIRWYDETISRQISDVVFALQKFPVNIRLATNYAELALFRISTEDFAGIPLVGLREPIFSPWERTVKRLVDVLGASILLLFALPFLLVVIPLIRLDSAGPVIFGQKRIGIHGRSFIMYKFRTMYNHNIDETKVNVTKQPNDPRVTRVGRFLRRTSLDEIPQFFNVLRGDMSLVGPRPELPDRVNLYHWWQHKRFEVPQGITGWWQVRGRADRPMHLHTEDDLYYIEHYSLWLDLKILWLTALVVVTGKGAF